MVVGLFQYDPGWEDKEKNKEKILQLISESSPQLDLLIFPEMTLTGYTMNTDLGEVFDLKQSPTLQFFSTLAKNLSINIIAGFIEREYNKSYNTLIVVDRTGNVRAKYRKIHLFSFAGEEKYYCPGDKPEIVKLENINIGLSICYDLRFPELFRLYGKAKVDLIVNIANWPDTRIEHYVALLRARAIENLCYVAGVNRVGREKRNIYDGRSSIYDALGNELISLKDKEAILIADIDFSNILEVRRRFPFLEDVKLI